MAKVLIVEDEKEIIEVIADLMTSEHHISESSMNGADALALLQHSEFDLIILDWCLPGKAGIDVLREFRQSGGRTPIIFLTGRSGMDDKEIGFFTGADDYLSKPFEVRELRARVRALLRRSSDFQDNIIEYKHLKMNLRNHSVLVSGKDVELKVREFALLELLLRNRGQVFTLDALISRVWESDQDVSYDAVRQCVTRIRKKIDMDESSSIIKTIAGLGYKIGD